MTKEKILNAIQERIDFNKEEQKNYEEGLKRELEKGNIREAIDYEKNVYACKRIKQVLYSLGFEIANQELNYDYEEEEKRMREKVSDALTIVLEDETVFPEVNDEEYDKMVCDIADNLLNDPDFTLTNFFMNETRNRALNHPIIQEKRAEIKKAAKK